MRSHAARTARSAVADAALGDDRSGSKQLPGPATDVHRMLEKSRITLSCARHGLTRWFLSATPPAPRGSMEIRFTTGETKLGAVLIASPVIGLCAVSLRESVVAAA